MTVEAQLIGDCTGIVAVRDQILCLAERQSDRRRPPAVLIVGETGTGKGVVARLLHTLGPRRERPFVDVNCAAIPETLLEAELFGFERGAFTDARQAKAGLFQTAHRGSIFLDEIGLLPAGLQPKLLKVLEEGEVRRLGRTRSETVEVAVLAATSESLEDALCEGRFLDALYHRLSVVRIALPPLRDRGTDVLRLAKHFLGRACQDHRLPLKTLSTEAQQVLLNHPWPGNVRELANLMERVALLGDGDEVTAAMLGLPGPDRAKPSRRSTRVTAAMLGLPGPDRAKPSRRSTRKRPEAVLLREVVGDVEREHLLTALHEAHWNVTHAAARLGIPPNTLRYRMKKHGLQPEAGPEKPERSPEIPARVTTPQAPLRWEQRHLALLRVCVMASGEALSATTTDALEAIVDKLQSFGGYLEDLGSGAVVAVFGRDPTEDAARRAAHAALAIQKMMERARAERNRHWVTTAAIHAGPFLVGEMGGMRAIDADAKRAALAVLEDAVQRGSADTIVVTAGAMRFLERRFELAPIGRTHTGTSIWRLLEGRDAAVAARGRLTPFTGRQSELGLVLHRLALAKEGRGQVVAVVGDAGIGKSRLLLEFRRAQETAGVRFLEGCCYSYTTTQPYVPLLEVIRQACGIGEADDFGLASGAVGAALERVGGNPGRDAVYLLHLLGFREASEQLVDFAPSVLKARAVEALRLLCFGTGKEPVILAVEDLHWIDQASEEFLKVLVEHVPAVRAVIVVTYRPGYRPPWADRSYATQISLPPLSGSESRGVLEATLGRAAVPETVTQVILRRAEGNPFFLEEMARAVGADQQATAELDIPDTIQSVLRARLDRVSPDVRALLQCAAVIGKDVQLTLLRTVADEPEDAVRRGLDELHALEFLYKTRTSPEVEYTFKHALTHEVAYGSLHDDRRRAFHRRIVETLERIHLERASPDVERLAHHAVQGEMWGKAVAYLREAGTKALMRAANIEAVAYFTQGLDVAERLPPTREHLRQQMELLLGLGQVFQVAEGFAALQAEKAYSRARELGQQIGEPRDLFRAMWGLWLFSVGRGRMEAAQRIAEELLAVAQRQDDPPLLLEGHHPMWATMLWRGDLRAARRHVEHGMALYNREQHRSHAVLYGGHDPGVCCRSMAGLVLWLLGYPTSAVEQSHAAVNLARGLSHPYSLAHAFCWAGMLHCLRRDVEATREFADSTVALSTEHGFRQWLAVGKILDGWGLAQQGCGEAAIAQIRAGIAEYRALGAELLVPYLFSLLAAAHVRNGDTEESLSAALQGLEVAAVTGEQVWSAELWRLQGESMLGGTPSDESQAEAAFRQALEIARRQAAGLWELRALTSLARLRKRQGARDEARGMLADAYRRITEGFDTPDLRDAKLLLNKPTGSVTFS